MLSLDVTGDVIDEALKENVDLVITHHPLIFDPIKSVTADTLLYKAVASYEQPDIRSKTLARASAHSTG